MSADTAVAASNAPLTAEHCQELARAAERARPVRNAARVASFNAWVTGVIAALSMPFAFFSLAGFLVAVGLALVAYNEFRGRRRLLAFDPTGATLLSRNQFGFLMLIVVYCLWAIYENLSGDNALLKELAANPDLKAAGISDDFLTSGGAFFTWCILGFYSLVILLSAIFQGGNAIYYATRRKLVEKYVAETPAWIRDLQRATMLA